MDESHRIAELNFKYWAGTINEEELHELQTWNNANPLNKERFQQRMDENNVAENLLLYEEAGFGEAANKEQIEREFSRRRPVVTMRAQWWKISAAAAGIIAISLLSYRMVRSNNKAISSTASSPVLPKNDFLPGAQRAMLTLDNGKTIALDTSERKALTRQGSALVSQAAGGLLSYVSESVHPTEFPINTLTTPRAGQYQLVLSDGTKVWLNNSSSITYPVSFTGAYREVKLKGEAYFEVVHNSAKPFRVRSGSSMIEDIGTSFNVAAYSDDPSMTITLVEGSVAVGIDNHHEPTYLASSASVPSRVILKPGEQAQISTESVLNSKTSTDKINVLYKVNTGEATAWKDGLFQFRNASLRTVLRQLSRWYDVDEVVYEKDARMDRSFSGTIPRDYNASDVLKILELSGVRFKIQGKTIIVSE